MVILSAIGAFFARIWKWIKETAWIQPLLIVGIVFGVIFSINPIVNAITSLQEELNSSETFYRNYQKSLVNGEDSDADALTKAIYKIQSAGSVNPEELKSVRDAYGSKFFVTYVSESCESCKETRGGFETLKDNWDKYIDADYRADGFKLYSIFTDEVTNEADSKETAFVKYMNRNSEFFELAAGVAYNSEYALNNKISETDITYIADCDAQNFLTPTIMLVDLTDKASTGSYGVTEMLFGLSSDRDDQKAEVLADCWMHQGDFKA